MAKNRDVMTKDPVFCQPGDSLRKVADIMKQEDVGSVPVVESVASRRLVGIITDRDIIVKAIAEGRSPDAATVKDAMTPIPVSCREEDDVDHALKLMKERQVRRMPIVDSAGHLTGIIAQADVATRVNKDSKTGELVEAISETGTSRH
jgi:CBS domain-containing protein